MTHRWAIFLSGKGSTAQAVLDCLSQVDVRLVVSSNPQAPGLARARRFGISTIILSKQIDWQQLNLELQRYGIQKIFLLGFMKLIPQSFCEQWQNRMLNIHPSLLPSFKGLHAIEKSYQAQAPMGVSLHQVTAQMDAGKIILQKKICELPQKFSWNEIQILMAFAEQNVIRTFITGQQMRFS